jgi:hypothetical protein
MSNSLFNKNNQAPIENLVELFEQFVFAYNLSPEFSSGELEILRKKLMEIDGIDEEFIQKVLQIKS